MNEIMAAVASGTSGIRSAITLAALEDSGWYRANYSVAEPLLWGRGEGCTYITEPCVGGPSGTLHGMCTTAGETGCTADYRARGSCNLATYGSDLPSQFQHFEGNPTAGGAFAEAD